MSMYQKTTVTTPNADGSTTTSTTATYTTVSTEKGKEGDSLGGTQRVTSNTVDASGNPVGKPTDSGPIHLGSDASIKAIGNEAFSKLVASATSFAATVDRDIMAHPFRYAMHAAGFALPFLHIIPGTMDGIITGVEALHEAHSLQQEMR
jgi:hypothetical protein